MLGTPWVVGGRGSGSDDHEVVMRKGVRAFQLPIAQDDKKFE